jgi:hypothetical protein
MRLDLDTEIRFLNGVRAGTLQKAIIGENGRVDSIVMSTDEIVSRNLIVPVAALSEGAGDVLTLNLAPDEVDNLPDYTEEMVPTSPEGWTQSADSAPGDDVFPGTLHDPGMMPVVEMGNVPEGATIISQGTEIWCEGDRWGVVDEVLLDDAGNVSAFVGRPDSAEEHDRIIPFALVSDLNPLALTLSCTLEDLPNYTQEINDELEEPDAE